MVVVVVLVAVVAVVVVAVVVVPHNIVGSCFLVTLHPECCRPALIVFQYAVILNTPMLHL